MSTSGVLYDDKPGKMFTKYLELTYYKILNIHLMLIHMRYARGV